MITQNVLKTETRYCTTYHQTHAGANFTTSFCHIQMFERMQSHLLPTNSLQTIIMFTHIAVRLRACLRWQRKRRWKQYYHLVKAFYNKYAFCRMRIARSSSHIYPSMHWAGVGCVYPNMHWAWGCLPGGSAQGECLPGGRGGGISTQEVCLPEGCLPRGCLLRGCVCPGCVSQHALRQTPPVNRMTDWQV